MHHAWLQFVSTEIEPTSYPQSNKINSKLISIHYDKVRISICVKNFCVRKEANACGIVVLILDVMRAQRNAQIKISI